MKRALAAAAVGACTGLAVMLLAPDLDFPTQIVLIVLLVTAMHLAAPEVDQW